MQISGFLFSLWTFCAYSKCFNVICRQSLNKLTKKKSITEYTNIYLVQKNLRLQNIS